MATFYLGALLAFVALVAVGRASWAVLALTGVFDLTLLPPLLYTGQFLGLLIAVHAACCLTVAAWSYRLRVVDAADVRAKAGEAGRILFAAWVGFALVVIVSALSRHAGRTVDLTSLDNVVLALFSLTAVVTVLGPGYTRYLEAVAKAGDLNIQLGRSCLVFAADLAHPGVVMGRALNRGVRWLARRTRERRPTPIEAGLGSTRVGSTSADEA